MHSTGYFFVFPGVHSTIIRGLSSFTTGGYVRSFGGFGHQANQMMICQMLRS